MDDLSTCTRCNQNLFPTEQMPVWLLYSLTDGFYHDQNAFPESHESAGAYAFDARCARIMIELCEAFYRDPKMPAVITVDDFSPDHRRELILRSLWMDARQRQANNQPPISWAEHQWGFEVFIDGGLDHTIRYDELEQMETEIHETVQQADDHGMQSSIMVLPGGAGAIFMDFHDDDTVSEGDPVTPPAAEPPREILSLYSPLLVGETDPLNEIVEHLNTALNELLQAKGFQAFTVAAAAALFGGEVVGYIMSQAVERGTEPAMTHEVIEEMERLYRANVKRHARGVFEEE